MTPACEKCGQPFDADGEWAGLCYPCFEKYADETWWEMAVCLPAPELTTKPQEGRAER